jgi:hypothetical protein
MGREGPKKRYLRPINEVLEVKMGLPQTID